MRVGTLLISCVGLAIMLVSAIPAAESFEYEFPVYRVVLTPGDWSLERIQQEAQRRDISVSVESDDVRGEFGATEWSTEYFETFQLRDRLTLAGFEAERETRMIDYREAKNAFPLETFSTFTDLGEFAPAQTSTSAAEVEAIFNDLSILEARPGITTEQLVDYLGEKIAALKSAEESSKAKAEFLIGKHYYLRGLAETKTRMELFNQVGFRIQRFEPITSVENRSYITALQHFQASAAIESPLRETAYYHCAAALYGIRDQGEQRARIPQALEAYREYVERYPNGTWARRAAMNIVGLEFELHRMDRQRPIAPAIAKAQQVLFSAEGDANRLGYEELRSALMMIEMLWESGDSEAALNVFDMTFGSLNTTLLSESLYSTYSTAAIVAAAIYRDKEEFRKAGDLMADILSLCTKEEHFLRGSLEYNLDRFRRNAYDYYRRAGLDEEAQKYEVEEL